MKRKLCAIAMALLLLLSVASCGPKAGYDEAGNLYIRQSGVSYDMAPYSYEPNRTDREYTTVKTGKVTISLYEVEGVAPEVMLADDFNTLYYATTFALPTLAQMQVDSVVCYNEGNVGAARQTLTDPGRIAAVVEAYGSGRMLPEADVRHLIPDAVKHATLNFRSAAYPGFCYALTYLEYGESVKVDGTDYGTAFLYDRYGACYIAVGDVLAGILS